MPWRGTRLCSGDKSPGSGQGQRQTSNYPYQYSSVLHCLMCGGGVSCSVLVAESRYLCLFGWSACATQQEEERAVGKCKVLVVTSFGATEYCYTYWSPSRLRDTFGATGT